MQKRLLYICALSKIAEHPGGDNMKNQGNRVGGLILLIISLIFVVFIVTITIVLSQVANRMEGPAMPVYLFPLLGGAPAVLILTGAGLFMFIKGTKSRRIMQTGRKTECKVYTIIRVMSGYQLVVTYHGESGSELMHTLIIKYRDALLLKPNMVLECYVDGEDCYVDESRIVIKEGVNS